MPYVVEAANASNQAAMLHFLRQHENYSLFLLGNFENYGLALAEAPYSGNFKLIRSEGEVVGVFCLTRKGSLLIEAPSKEPIFELVLASCREESMPIKGVIGNWDLCHPFWEFLKTRQVIKNEAFTSKEILYSVDLSAMSYHSQPGVRFLTEADYSQWKPLRLDYLMEQGLPNDLGDEYLFKLYADKVKKKISWGFFLEGKLVSMADLNAKALDLGQVGGVYTIPSCRGKGYAKAVMQQLLADAKSLHAIRKMIIFTGENNLAAQKLYHSLRVSHIGYFALLIGNGTGA